MARAKPRFLTPRQREILDWIKAFIREHGMPPTVREIGDAFDIRSSSVFDLLKALERKGYLRRGDLGARSLVVEDHEAGRKRQRRGVRTLQRVDPDAEKSVVAVPILGCVAAGRPILAEENVIGEIQVDADMVRGGQFFALEVQGDSMTGAGVNNGDIVLVRQQPLAENGDIVVALFEGEATVKRLHLRGGRIELRPENPEHQRIQVGPEDDLRIAGKVVGVKRSGPVPG